MIFKKLFQIIYLNSAFDLDPEDLFDVYDWFLRNGFSFDDKQIASCLGITKSAISKNRKKYERETKKALQKYASEMAL